MKLAFSESGNRINMTVRVLFFPYTHLSLILFSRMTMVILGIKAGGLSTEGACLLLNKVARPQLFETSPATRIRRTGLRTSVQGMAMSHLDNTTMLTNPEIF